MPKIILVQGFNRDVKYKKICITFFSATATLSHLLLKGYEGALHEMICNIKVSLFILNVSLA